jgi:glycosyltransferase involved in cell wall biosynthesis
MAPVETSRADENDPRLRLIFLSRICAKKGLTTLLAALSDVPEPVILSIFGPKEDMAYWRECEELIDKCPVSATVRYHGVVPPYRTVELFSQHDLFVFPTAGENFGHAIAESLAGSCPVMTTDTTPWSDTLRGGAGLVLNNSDAASWAIAISNYARLSPDARFERRRLAGQAYVLWRDRHPQSKLFDLTLGLQAVS